MTKPQEIIRYKGPLTYERIGELLSKMTVATDEMGVGLTVKKKVYSAMVESLENIYKHQNVIEDNPNSLPGFTLSVDGDVFYISASNSILNKKADELKVKLDKVNALDKEGLKELYKAIILSGYISPKGGAGLGIVNIAKVTENKIQYSFDKLNDTHSYLTIHITISRYGKTTKANVQ